MIIVCSDWWEFTQRWWRNVKWRSDVVIWKQDPSGCGASVFAPDCYVWTGVSWSTVILHIPQLPCHSLHCAGNRMCFHKSSSQENTIFTFSPLFLLSFSRLDIYRKVPKDLTQPTYTGAFSKCLTSDAGFHRPVSFYVNVLPCVISLLVSLALSLGWLIVPALNVIGVAAWLTMAWNAAQWASDFFGLEWLSS